MMLSRHPLIMWLLLDQVEVLAIEDGHWSSSYTPWQTLTSWIGCGNDLRRSSHDICEFQCLNGESQRVTISLLLRQFRDLEYELTRWWSTLSPLYNAHMLECPLHCSDAGQTSDLWFLVGATLVLQQLTFWLHRHLFKDLSLIAYRKWHLLVTMSITSYHREREDADSFRRRRLNELLDRIFDLYVSGQDLGIGSHLAFLSQLSQLIYIERPLHSTRNTPSYRIERSQVNPFQTSRLNELMVEPSWALNAHHELDIGSYLGFFSHLEVEKDSLLILQLLKEIK